MVDRWINPYSGLAVLVAVYSANALMMLSVGEYTSTQTEYLFGLGIGLLVIWWVYLDRRRRRISVPFEFEAFAFFLWPFVITWYLFRTRRWYFVPVYLAMVGTYIFSDEILLAAYDFVSPTGFQPSVPEFNLELQLQ